ncbi:3-isopropylmalate dehydratase large subunit [Desulfovibrio litoralis]|uniref:3-isopropylmalate dehydratase large subunit n=1 Tax=Desulfovibrio litoralis DSM 11393 TaxID=1121455 RepID=A0A1M7SP11_9BACT|nr:3-isopropylmalate dehydratase large subunit [Desulfovibrio litoralis]SHN60195.1 3-isopropylmalate dehydratase, large subunit [Desulfovibrio litoralis DSM 11393]
METKNSKYTLVEAIIAKHIDPKSGEKVEPGAICRVNVDFAFANDITTPPAIHEFHRMGADQVFDKQRCAVVQDHFTPNKDIASATQVKKIREFAKAKKMLFWEVGRVGVEHAFLPEQGYVLPGDIVLGADSHTCTGGALGALATGVGSSDLAAAWALGETWLRVPETIRVEYTGKRKPFVTSKDMILALIGMIGVEGANYMAIEFAGEGIADLNMDERFTMANMAIEAGGKCGLFVPDEKTLAYAKARAKREFTPVYPGADAKYAKVIKIDLNKLEPVVALPHLPDNVKPVTEVKDMKIDQVFIGSCTNGRITDLEQAASILKGRKVHDDVRLIVIPASYEVYNQAMEKGYIQTFLDAGAVITTPSCGPCLGGHLGILAPGERCLSTSNRNFIGRMGSTESEVILASPLVAATGAVLGRVAHPNELK